VFDPGKLLKPILILVRPDSIRVKYLKASLTKEEKLCRGLYYKLFYGRNLRIFVIS